MNTLLRFLFVSFVVLAASCVSESPRSNAEVDELYSRLMAVVNARQRRLPPAKESSLDPFGEPFNAGQTPQKLDAEDREIVGIWKSGPYRMMLINSNHDLLIVDVREMGRLKLEANDQLTIKRNEPLWKDEFSLGKGWIRRVHYDEQEEFTRK
jgi:hypothetical protein